MKECLIIFDAIVNDSPTTNTVKTTNHVELSCFAVSCFASDICHYHKSRGVLQGFSVTSQHGLGIVDQSEVQYADLVAPRPMAKGLWVISTSILC